MKKNHMPSLHPFGAVDLTSKETLVSLVALELGELRKDETAHPEDAAPAQRNKGLDPAQPCRSCRSWAGVTGMDLSSLTAQNTHAEQPSEPERSFLGPTEPGR